MIPIQKNKKSAIKWVDYQNRKPTQQELDGWFKNGGSWGLAIVLGAVCGNIFSIDLDTDELFQQLKRRGAFPHGTCIFKSARGYHALMRASIIPYSVKEHNELLDPEFWELGIGGDRSLSNMPDTPGRGWVELYHDPITVDFEQWLDKYLNYNRSRERHKGTEVLMWCPYHVDERQGDPTANPSLSINTAKGVYQCFGCGAKGTVAQLLFDSEVMRFEVPSQVRASVQAIAVSRAFKIGVHHLPEVVGMSGDDLIEGIMGGGANAKVLINAERKMGKTTLGCNMGLCFANNLPLFNSRAIQQRSVTFIDFEFTAQAVYDYVEKQVQMLGGWPSDEMFQVVGGYDFKIDKPETMDELWRVLRAEPRSNIIIFDSIYAFCSNPNDIEQANKVLDFLNKLMVELKVAIIILHHTNAPGDQLIQKQPLGVLGRMLDRWCGTTLSYIQVGSKTQDSYYRRLFGMKRGGQGAVNVLLGYIENSMTLIEVNWDEVPGSNEDKSALLGANRRTLIVQQITLLCKPLGIKREDLAAEWGVSERSVYYYSTGENIPGDDVWPKIVTTQKRLSDLLTGKGAMQERCNGDAEPMQTTRDIMPVDGEKAPILRRTGENNKKIKATKKRASPKTKTAKVLEPSAPDCGHCKLQGQSRVEGWGECSAQGQWGRVVVVGQAPAEDEVKQGEPFVGRAGKILDKLLPMAGIERKMCRITNTCLCQLPKDQKKPTSTMIKACLPRLLAEIAEHRPDTILVLGEEAQMALMPAYPLSRYHGKRVEKDGVAYLLMYHPSAAQHNPYYTGVLMADFEAVQAIPPIEEISGEYTVLSATVDFSFEPFEMDLATIDTETKGLYGELLGGSYCPSPATSIYFRQRDFIKALQTGPFRHVLGWNLKYDLRVLADNGFDWHDWELDDAELLAYCMNYDNLKLKVMETQELNLDHPDLAAKTAELPPEQVGRYCCQDTDATRRLWDYLMGIVTERELGVYNVVEKPLLPVLVDMEVLGIQVDLPYVREWKAKLEAEAGQITKELIAEYDVTEKLLSSPKQLGDWLTAQGVKLPTTEASDQYATGKEILAGIMDAHPAIKPILRLRQCRKLESTYADACLEHADANGVVHTQYNQAKVKTGRLSSSDPNLQNLPYLWDARRPFVARPGNKLVTIDYSQIDMAALAVMTQDAGLLKAFRDKVDIHNWVSDGLWGDHDAMHRHIIKAADYLATYGGTGSTLHQYLNAPMGEFDLDKMGEPPSRAECDAIIEKFYELCPSVRYWQTETIAFAHKHGYVDDWHGRRRFLPQLESRNYRIRAAGERQAINFPIAGTAGNIFKISTALAGRVMTPVLNIHDEWVFDIAEDKIDTMLPRLVEAILSIDFPIPLKVKHSMGDNLGELLQ